MAVLFFCAWWLAATNHSEFICPRCGAAYPMRGTCFGYAGHKHDAAEAVQR